MDEGAVNGGGTQWARVAGRRELSNKCLFPSVSKLTKLIQSCSRLKGVQNISLKKERKNPLKCRTY